MLEQFEDRERGGFFFVSHDHERLIHRPKTAHDNATPSGNGIAAFALQRLGHALGEPRYIDAAERTLRVFGDAMERSPSAHTSLLAALEEALTPPRIVVLRGAPGPLAAWGAALARTYRPDTLVLAIPDAVRDLPAALDKDRAGDVSAWVCQGVTCQPPVFELAGLEQAIAPRARSS
jgi:uncharacterized protein YyaL (SSP411 family)